MSEVLIRKHADDDDCVEIYSKDKKGTIIIWGVMHSDVLAYMGVGDYELAEADLVISAAAEQ